VNLVRADEEAAVDDANEDGALFLPAYVAYEPPVAFKGELREEEALGTADGVDNALLEHAVHVYCELFGVYEYVYVDCDVDAEEGAQHGGVAYVSAGDQEEDAADVVDVQQLLGDVQPLRLALSFSSFVAGKGGKEERGAGANVARRRGPECEKGARGKEGRKRPAFERALWRGVASARSDGLSTGLGRHVIAPSHARVNGSFSGQSAGSLAALRGTVWVRRGQGDDDRDGDEHGRGRHARRRRVHGDGRRQLL